MLIWFANHDHPLNIPRRKLLRTYLLDLFRAEKRSIESVGFIICSDEYLLSHNNSFLKHDTFTDVISFTLSPSHSPLIGEVYISGPRIRENAKIYEYPVNHELHRVIFHGALHLSGYNDQSASQKKLMTAKENFHLAQYLP